MRVFIFFTFILYSVYSQSITVDYKQYLLQFRKFSITPLEFKLREDIYNQNLEYINRINSQNLTYQLGLTQFTDLTESEFKSRFVSGITKLNLRTSSLKTSVIKLNTTSNPKALDWREYNIINPVRNQGSCGSCYAYSVLGAIESSYAQKTGVLPELSKQQIVDCSSSFGNNGCEGGTIPYTFAYLIKHGIATEAEYPYQGEVRNCKNFTSYLSVSGYESVSVGDETLLESYVAQQPVAIIISASQPAFQHYVKGVLKGSCPISLDHAMLVVGYGTLYCSKLNRNNVMKLSEDEYKKYSQDIQLCNSESNDIHYWILKNSWGYEWGENGYMRIYKGLGGNGMCGLASTPAIPTLNL